MKKEPISIERDFDSFIICYVSIAMIFLTDASQDNLKMIYIQVSFFWYPGCTGQSKTAHRQRAKQIPEPG